MKIILALALALQAWAGLAAPVADAGLAQEVQPRQCGVNPHSHC
ncbi:uncharacterized protein E0L32_005252 [Thyridium curvatum]|uniref:Uncharacterized protein n=1 Tax=Thyridium curvatum TaxID=1093900 RepID=A0A507BDA5_9PEZI|nr:uncharacterized protein E0L32_005252 [Thyridium curvatum]TPX14560.1 hypothetical protein E0L32_005252 [Thyridium curvatum]